MSAARGLYTVALAGALPALALWAGYRGLRQPGYRRHLAERFGHVPSRAGDRPCIWLHAASVGEVSAALPLLEELQRRAGDCELVVTTVTPTGRERLLGALEPPPRCHYLPVDLPGAVARFLDRVRPELGVIMETELWPNLYAACARREIPLAIANGRISPGSWRAYRMLGPLLRETLAGVSALAAQTEADADRFRDLGVPPGRVRVAGNLKFDLRVPEGTDERGRALRRAWGEARPVWIAASTHPGEEQALLGIHARIREHLPEALLVLVPRHPERFEAVAALCARQGWRMARYSRAEEVLPATAVVLGDVMGQLMDLYAASDVAFLGGSLTAVGGHNPVEPAALGLPAVIGPQTGNVADSARLLAEAGALWQVPDAAAGQSRLTELMSDREARRRAGQAGRATVADSRGALESVQGMIESLLPAPLRH